MNLIAMLREKNHWAIILVLLIISVGPMASVASGDLMSTICRNEVVSVGDKKGIVLDKCGPPLAKSQDSTSSQVTQTTRKKKTGKKQADDGQNVTTKTKTVKERTESWTYKIDGSYRTFIFKEGKLATIEAGGLAN